MNIHTCTYKHHTLTTTHTDYTLTTRCGVPPSRSERIVAVMRELHRRRQKSDVFAGRHAFLTPRDLFRCVDILDVYLCVYIYTLFMWRGQKSDVFAGEHAFLTLRDLFRCVEMQDVCSCVIYVERCRKAMCVRGDTHSSRKETMLVTPIDWCVCIHTSCGLNVQQQEPPTATQKNPDTHTYIHILIYIYLHTRTRWAERAAASATDSYAEVAREGYMLLAEGLRRKDDKESLRAVLEKELKAQVDVRCLYDKDWGQDLKILMQDRGIDASDWQQRLTGLVSTHSTRRLVRLVSRCVRFSEPALLVGETGTGKTTICQAIASALNTKLHIVNCHANTETADLLGGYRPVRGRQAAIDSLREVLKHYVRLAQAALDEIRTLDTQEKMEDEGGQNDMEVDAEKQECDDADRDDKKAKRDALAQALEDACTQGGSVGEAKTIMNNFTKTWEALSSALSRARAAECAMPSADTLSELKSKASEANELCVKCKALFLWYDGPLVVAMREGHMILLDEISLAEDSVLERLNSVLEPSRTLTLAERGGEVVVAHKDFRFVATMNPGGDFGKKELSPALRNRLTELWVEPVSERCDVDGIVRSAMSAGLQASK
jgi:midasin (ATPase involved in ribosome maturation)